MATTPGSFDSVEVPSTIEVTFITGAMAAAYRRLCKDGTTVTLDWYEDADHQSVVSASTFDVFFWLEDRLSGIQTSGCHNAEIPS